MRQMWVTPGVVEKTEMSVQLQPGGQACGSFSQFTREQRLIGAVAQVGATQLRQSPSVLQESPKPS